MQSLQLLCPGRLHGEADFQRSGLVLEARKSGAVDFWGGEAGGGC